MLRGKLINDAASLNNFNYISAIEYMIGGTGATLNFQILDPQTGMRFIPPSTAVVKVTFNNQDSTTFEKTGSFISALDQSLIAVTLTQSDLAQLLDGNLNFTVDLLGDATQVLNGIIFGALKQIVISVARI